MLKTIGRIIAETIEAVAEVVVGTIEFIYEFASDVFKSLFNSDYRKYGSILDYPTQEQEYLNQIVALMEQRFPEGKIGEYLVSLEPVERTAVVGDFTRELLTILHLENVEVEISYEMSAGTMGCYYFEDKKIVINGAYLTSSKPLALREMIDTVIHESRHAMQLKALTGENIYGFTNNQLAGWIYNLEHPIDGQRNFKGYRKQDIEVEAFDYAAVAIETYEGRAKV